MMNNDIIKQIKANKQANSFIKTNKLKDEDILKNLSAFTQFIDQESICANCDGKKCSSIIEGLKCELSYSNKVNVEYYDCPIYNETTDNNEFEVIDYTEKQVEIYDTPARMQLYNVFSNVRENLKSDNQNKKGIYLHGNYGTGKSLLMYEFAKRLSKNYSDITRK